MSEEQVISSNLEDVADGATETGAAAALGFLSAKPHVIADLPKRKVLSLGGEIQSIDLDPAPRKHVAHSVDALVAIAAEKSAVWHHGDTVQLVIDNSEGSFRDESVTWPLTKTEAWAAATAQRGPMKQEEAIELLSVQLRKAVRDSPTAQAVLDRIRSIKFSTTDEDDQTRTKGSASMGREIMAKVINGENIPEEFVIGVPRWGELGIMESIELCVDIDPENRRIRIRATKDEVALVEENAQAKLGKYLREQLDAATKKTPVYAGVA